MPRTSNKLTATTVSNAKYSGTPKKLFDGEGLYLHVKQGGKYWRMKYRYGGRERLLAIGVYPQTSLKEAREARAKAKELLGRGEDPSANKRSRKAAQSQSEADSFESVAAEFMALQEKKLSKNTVSKSNWLLSLLYPKIGKMRVGAITPNDFLTALRAIEARGTIESAHRAKQKASQVFNYAIQTGRITYDPTANLRGALTPVVTKNFASITDPAGIAGLLRAIDGYEGFPSAVAALRIAPLLFVRPGELRSMEWAELSLADNEWRIPAAKTKMKEMHIVPLSNQAKSILVDLQPITGDGRYVFPGVRNQERPLSENTLNAALRRLGYSQDEMTAHGFRAMASTRLNEMGWSPDIIERQLAHAERNKVRAAYNRAQYLDERRRMMQVWADYLDSLRERDKNVIPIRGGGNA